MDPSHITHLTLYLQALHDASAASENHTSLLLNCYSKLKDEDKINQLVSRGGFDIEHGIRICKTAGYFYQALQLAKNAQLHDWVITLLFEDIADPSQVVAYIAQLDPTSIETAMKKYGGSLVKQLPRECTDILVFLCTRSAYPEDFVPFYVDLRTWCIDFLERVFSARFAVDRESDSDVHLGRDNASRIAVSNTLFELYLENVGPKEVLDYIHMAD